MEEKLDDPRGQASEGFKSVTRILMATGDENLAIENAKLIIDDQQFNYLDELIPNDDDQWIIQFDMKLCLNNNVMWVINKKLIMN